MGKLNSKRISNREKDLLKELVVQLIKADIKIDGNVNSDELIVYSTKDEIPELYEKLVEVISKSPYPEIWRLNAFRTRPVLEFPNSGFYPFIKAIYPVIGYGDWHHIYSLEICCCPKIYMTQVMKYLMKEEIEKEDLIFGDEYGNLHTFDYPLIY